MSAFHWTQGNAEGLRNLCRYELKHRASVCPSMCSAALGFQSLSSLINFGKLVVLIMNQQSYAISVVDLKSEVLGHDSSRGYHSIVSIL